MKQNNYSAKNEPEFETVPHDPIYYLVFIIRASGIRINAISMRFVSTN